MERLVLGVQWWIVIFSLLGSIGAVCGAALLLALPDKTRKKLTVSLISYATGTLLGASFLGLIPNALQRASSIVVMQTVLSGIVLLFLLEKMLLWRHAHEGSEKVQAAGILILVGDAFHNFVDGLVIASAFLTSIPLGISTAIAIVAHELPQELGDFGILLDSGFRKWKAFGYNTLSATATLLGALLAYYSIGTSSKVICYALSIAAASFLYIAMSDLMPMLNRRMGLLQGSLQFLLFTSGVMTIYLL